MPDPEIIYEGEDFLAVNKPAGLQVHKAKISSKRREASGAGEETLADWFAAKYPEAAGVGDDPETRPGIVHRLDKGTSGIMLLARTQKGFDHLKSLFGRREMSKTYMALSWGKLEPRTGTISKPIGVKSGTLKRSVHSKKMAKEAVTEYKVKKYLRDEAENIFSLAEVMPKTGRTHQIRVHLASLGHPIVGDRLYGKKNAHEGTRLMLHAFSLEFITPEGKRLKLEADPSPEFQAFLAGLREEQA